jgi:cyclopropane fatty-acyl-phospholipid synthase-like methyltransferase
MIKNTIFAALFHNRLSKRMSKIQEYYDDTAEYYQKIGLNDRNYKIHELLLRFGLQKSHRVLEIGCGVGVQTKLLAKACRHVIALDISPKSIEIAKHQFSALKNIEWLVGDAFDLDFKTPFDVIVLPDVLQYIPLEKQKLLFEKLKSWLSPKGFILLHFPTANFVAWSKANDPSKLNIDDLEISDWHLAQCAAAANLEIKVLEKYALWHRGGDYQYVVLQHPRKINDFDTQSLSFLAKAEKHLKRNYLRIKSLF